MKLFLPALLSILFITGCGPTREWVPCTNSGCDSCEGVGNAPCVACEQKGSLPCEVEDTLMNDLLDKKGCKGGVRICMECGGQGKTVEKVEQNCRFCKGSGRKGYGTTAQTCTYCSGKGSSRGYGKIECPRCGGKKKVTCYRCNGTTQYRCPTCNGTGRANCGRWVVVEKK